MIHDLSGAIDYDERGSGPTIVLVPGSCSTGAAWRPVIAALGEQFRCVTTSLPGYGGTAERRNADDAGIGYLASAVETVIRHADAPVHLVGHSFGGLVATAVALRGNVALASLTVLEAPAVMLLRDRRDDERHYRDFRDMTDRYFAEFNTGDREAVGRMIDFYGGKGTFSSWPERVRAYAMDTTAVNIRDWHSAFGFALSPEVLAPIEIPSLVAWGGNSHPAAQRANALLSASLKQGYSATIPGAAHFMIATHATEVAAALSSHVLAPDASRLSG